MRRVKTAGFGQYELGLRHCYKLGDWGKAEYGLPMYGSITRTTALADDAVVVF